MKKLLVLCRDLQREARVSGVWCYCEAMSASRLLLSRTFRGVRGVEGEGGRGGGGRRGGVRREAYGSSVQVLAGTPSSPFKALL